MSSRSAELPCYLALIVLFSIISIYAPAISFLNIPARNDFQAHAEETTESKSLIINEIAWMGTRENWREEWIELYNNTDREINLSGWKIKTGRQNEGTSIKKETSLNGAIRPRSYFLLKKGEEKKLNGVKADITFKKTLENKGSDVILIDAQNKEIDAVICSGGWFAGSNLTKRTMERISPDQEGSDSKNWRDSSVVGGTPRAKNSEERAKDNHPSSFFASGYPFLIKDNVFGAKLQYYFYEYKAALIPLSEGALLSLVLTSLLIIYTKKKN